MFVTSFCSSTVFIVKYVGPRCAFNIFWVFPVLWNILADLLRNTCLLAWVQKVMVCDLWLVDFNPFSVFPHLVKWLTEQKNPKSLPTLQYVQCNTKNFAVNRKLFFLFLHLSCFELSMKQLSVFSTLLGQAQVAVKIKTELNTGNNILHYMWRNDYISESNPFS